MAGLKKYDLNPETLLYEMTREPLRNRLAKTALVIAMSIAIAALYFWLYSGVLGLEPPKLAILKNRNARWSAKVAVMNRNMDRYEEALGALEMRNDNVYRTIFGMNPIPRDIASPASLEEFDELGRYSPLRASYARLDSIMRQTYLVSKSFDEVASLSKQAGDMASCIPYISPISPAVDFRITSPFGGRADPLHGDYRMHTGVDFATKAGTPIYAVGDGVISSVKFQFFGYGNMVTIDHGFGYQTNYAHMREVIVAEGMKIKRGQCIGTVGNSGKTTGSHLHYEVEYKGNKVNPANFYDLSVSGKEYDAMVQKLDSESQMMLRPSFRVRTR